MCIRWRWVRWKGVCCNVSCHAFVRYVRWNSIRWKINRWYCIRWNRPRWSCAYWECVPVEKWSFEKCTRFEIVLENAHGLNVLYSIILIDWLFCTVTLNILHRNVLIEWLYFELKRPCWLNSFHWNVSSRLNILHRNVLIDWMFWTETSLLTK